MRILIIEDDPVMGSVLEQGLEEAGFSVDLVKTGVEGLAAATATRFDVISLDLMLSGDDGFAVCRALRQRKVSTPVIVLTARDAVGDRIRGLEAGADDYLVKPFAFAEYVARIRALARRHLSKRGAVLEMDGIRLDTAARGVSVNGIDVRLTTKEFDLLECFMHHPGQLLDKDQIAAHVWNYELEADANLIEVYVGRLRRKIATAGGGLRISTVRHGGYRCEAEPE